MLYEVITPGDARAELISLEDQLKDEKLKDPEKKAIEKQMDEINSKYALDMKPPEEVRMLRKDMQIVFQDRNNFV